MEYPIHGHVAAGFESVKTVFAANFTDDIDVGASFAVVHKGETVVDLWGGYQDSGSERPWNADTLVNVYSTTKGIASIAFAWVVEQGLLDYDAPVADYWPEFLAGKTGLTVGQMLSHQSGVCGVDQIITVEDLYDWQKMTDLLAAQKPFWEPGTASGYHAIVWGFLPGELIRRVTGRTMGQVLREQIAAPLQADCYIGLPESEMHRVSDMIGPNRARIQPDPAQFEGMTMPDLYPVALQNPVIRPWKDASSDAWRAAEIAAANGQANARGLAQIYGAMALGGQMNGTRVLSEATLEQMLTVEWEEGVDLVLNRQMRRGRGINFSTDEMHGPNPNAWGHSGAGGSTAFADPDAGLGIAYAMNQMQANLDGDTRAGRLTRAVYACL